MKVPKFKNVKEEHKFWDSHESTDYLDDFEETKDVVFVRPKKQVISLRLEPQVINKLGAYPESASYHKITPCGSGLQPRNKMIAAASRSHNQYNLFFPDNRNKLKKLANEEGLPTTTYARMLIIRAIRDKAT